LSSAPTYSTNATMVPNQSKISSMPQSQPN
jgi:hypothetical protein